METLTIRLPDAHRDRLATMAEQRGVSVNNLMEELALRALIEHDTEMRFRVRGARGRVDRGLAVLNRLDRFHSHVEDP